MKTEQIAYCLVRKDSRKYSFDRFSPIIYDARMPIFWNKKVASLEAEKRGAEVIAVVIRPPQNA